MSLVWICFPSDKRQLRRWLVLLNGGGGRDTSRKGRDADKKGEMTLARTRSLSDHQAGVWRQAAQVWPAAPAAQQEQREWPPRPDRQLHEQ